jgi:hypothetical protein
LAAACCLSGQQQDRRAQDREQSNGVALHDGSTSS